MKIKTYLLTSAVFFLGSMDLCFSQVTKQWDKTIGANKFDFLKVSQPSMDGGFFLGGQSNSDMSGDKSENSKGDYDYWIVKTDPMGTKIWDKTVGGSSSEQLLVIQPTSDAGLLMIGNSKSNISGDKSENSKGDFDYWIVKIDAAGKKRWDKTLGGNASDIPSCIQPTSDGGFLLGGSSYSNMSGDKSENSKGNSDYWIIKIDSLGKKIWDKTIGGNFQEELLSIQPTSDGGFLLGGNSSSNMSGDKSENSKGDYDYWIVKIDEMGNIKWDKTIGGSKTEFLSNIKTISGGGFLVSGWSESNMSGDKKENSKGNYDYWIVKIDEMGSIKWDKTIGGNSRDELHDAQSTLDGGFLLGGLSYSNMSGDKSENGKGDYDYWIVKIDASGNKLWDKTWIGNNRDELNDIQITSDGGFLLAGSSESAMGDDKTENSKGNYDYWVIKIKLDPITGVFTVYPTIGNLDCIFIDTSDAMYLPATVTVQELFFPFRIVIDQSITKKHECIDAKVLRSGLYILRITNDKGITYKTRIRIL